ncbi:hypothetical protein ACHAWF_002343 [Thalassiosira exigua]
MSSLPMALSPNLAPTLTL